MAAIFTICEAVREWLSENNEKGQEDESMYAQMMRKAKEAEKAKVRFCLFHVSVPFERGQCYACMHARDNLFYSNPLFQTI